MAKGVVRIQTFANREGQKWLKRERRGRWLLTVVGYIAYGLCILWIVDLLP